jgi:hypothetical protein
LDLTGGSNHGRIRVGSSSGITITLEGSSGQVSCSSIACSGVITGSGSGLSSLNASSISTGTLDNARLPASISVTNLAGSGSGITGLNASNISSGTINNSYLPSTISVTNVTASGTLTGANINTTNGISYNGSNRISFYWDGANVRAVVDGSLQGTIPNP